MTARDSSILRLAFVAAVFGGVVAGAILAFGRVSGTHINSAVTAAVLVRGRGFDRVLLLYFAAQIAACLAAGLLLRGLFAPDATTSFLGSTALAPHVTLPAGFALEVGGTFALALAALSVGRWTSRPAWQGGAVGATLFALIMIVGPLTGASFNPARSIGPALASGFTENLWLYLAAPVLGGAMAGAVADRLPGPRAKAAA